MDQPLTNIHYPSATDAVAQMLGHTDASPDASVLEVVTHPTTDAREAPLPHVLPLEEQIHQNVLAIKGESPIMPGIPSLIGKSHNTLSVLGRMILTVIPFVVVFAVGVLVYYTWFAEPATRPQVFQSLERKSVDSSLQKQAEFLALQKAERDNFIAWIRQYYFAVTDASALNMDLVAQNGLTNFENYLLKLNPRMNDVRHTGQTDAEQVLSGVDPVTGASLADWQKDLVAQYFDASSIRTRTPGTVAGSSVNAIMPRGEPSKTFQPLSTQLSGVLAESTVTVANPLPKVTPLVPTQTPEPKIESVIPQVAKATPRPVLSASAGEVVPAKPLVDNCAENKLGINTNVPGRMEIPTLGVNVPIIWTRDAKNFDTDLKSGVVHYPCTPLPGDIGTSYISGHSSNYAWIKASYNQIFAKLNDLPAGATFKVTVVGQNGKDIRLFYVVEGKQIFTATDQAQFINTALSRVALSTCWPINTNQKRLVAFAKLDRVEK